MQPPESLPISGQVLITSSLSSLITQAFAVMGKDYLIPNNRYKKMVGVRFMIQKMQLLSNIFPGFSQGPPLPYLC